MSPLVVSLITVVLIASSAFFVAVEFALIAARRHRLEDAAAGSRSARAALRSTTELSVLLAGSQLGITVCTLALGAITKPAVHHWLTPGFASWGLPGWAADAAGFVLALVIVTFLHLVVGRWRPSRGRSPIGALGDHAGAADAGVHDAHPAAAGRAESRRELVPAPGRRHSGGRCRRGRIRIRCATSSNTRPPPARWRSGTAPT